MDRDLHIGRSMFAAYAHRFPILEREVVDLVNRHDDLGFTPGHGPVPEPGNLDTIWWTPGGAIGSRLGYRRGALCATHPEPATQRRMVEIADELDAYLLDNDSEQYELWADGVLRPREVPLWAYRREWGIYLGIGDRRITPDEWFSHVATRPDFRLVDEVEAWLPSGLRTVACPPTAMWTGHPSGRAVPFFCDREGIDEDIQTRGYDDPVLHVCLDLARHFDVEIFVPDGRSFVWPPGADRPVMTRPGPGKP
jgi:hypothetical protein